MEKKLVLQIEEIESKNLPTFTGMEAGGRCVVLCCYFCTSTTPNSDTLEEAI